MNRDNSSIQKITVSKALTLLKDAKRPIPDFSTVNLEDLRIDSGWLIRYRNGRARTRVHLQHSLIAETPQEESERLERDKGPGFGLPLDAPNPLTQTSACSELATRKSRSKFIDVPVAEGDKKTISPRMLLQQAKRPTATPSPTIKKRITHKSTPSSRRKARVKTQQTISPLRHQPNFHADMDIPKLLNAAQTSMTAAATFIAETTLQEVLRLLGRSQSSLEADHRPKSTDVHKINDFYGPDSSEEEIERPPVEPIIMTDMNTIHSSPPDPPLSVQPTAEAQNMSEAVPPDLLEVLRILGSFKNNDAQRAKYRTVQPVQHAQIEWTLEKSRASNAILQQDIWHMYPVENTESLDKYHKRIAECIEPIEEEGEAVQVANAVKRTRIDTPADPVETKVDDEVDVNLIASILAGMKDGEILL